MRADRAAVERALKAPSPAQRFILLYGPDEAGSRALAKLAGASGGERVEMSGAELRGDPARLADEAASMSLFGEARHIVVEPAGEEVVTAVEGLLEAAAAGNMVVIVAGALKPTSKLLKLALASKQALALVSYLPDARNAPRLVQELAREKGLSIRPEVARMISDSTAGNRAIIEQELVKIALFLDAAPERPQMVEEEAIAAIGAAREEGDLSRLVDSVGNGDPARLQAELLHLSSEGIEGIPLIRAVLRRLAMLAGMRAEVESGRSVESVVAARGKAIFWKEKDAITSQLARWPAEMIARGMGRLLEAERQVKASGGLGPLAVDEELFAICRQAARLR
ncbi:MAG TPA: DNA polymerase III subunit delta [Allosphingosinicella sp.]|uniref:DNA polymerase III subunit delta n=1 Tax=Allosphingosinicella sp. TaxID=2823234 RepID=UPI002F2AC123